MTLYFFFIIWMPVLFWAGLIFWLSGIPGLTTGLGVWDLLLRKSAHMAEYAMLTLLLLRALARTWPAWSRQRALRLAALSALLYAVSDEIHQAFVPQRGPSARDVLIDAVGIAAVAAWVYCRRTTSEGRA